MLTDVVSRQLSTLLLQKQTNNGLRTESEASVILRTTHSPSQVSEAYRPALQVTVGASCDSIADATDIPGTPTILTLAQAYGPGMAARWIQSQLVAVDYFVGAKGKMSDAQMEELSVQILMEYKNMNLVEFILFCARLRSGRYEGFYGSVDPMRILKSLEMFWNERNRDIYKRREQEEKKEKEREYAERCKNSVTFEEWYGNLSEEDKEKVAPPMKAMFQKQMQ